MSNSYKYTESGEILIEADFQSLDNIDYILNIISDTGKGIPDDVLNNWGKPFNFKDKSVGTGLGQFLIDSISKKLSFKLLKPEKNKISKSGTVFKILIPVLSNKQNTSKIHDNEYQISFPSNQANKNKIGNTFNSVVYVVNNSFFYPEKFSNSKIYSSSNSKKTLITKVVTIKNENGKQSINNNNLKNESFIIQNKDSNKNYLNIITINDKNNNNNSNNLCESFLNITLECQNYNYNIEDKYRKLSLFNNLNLIKLKTYGSNLNNSSSNSNHLVKKPSDFECSGAVRKQYSKILESIISNDKKGHL